MPFKPQESYNPSYRVPKIADRVKSFSRLFRQTNIGIVGWAGTNHGISDRTATRFGTVMSQAYDYVAGNQKFAGLPGFLFEPTLSALNTPDPERRHARMALLRNIRGMAPDRQEHLAAYLRGTYNSGGLVTEQDKGVVQEFLGERDQDFELGGATGAEIKLDPGIEVDEYYGDQIDRAQEAESINLYSDLRSLFPEIDIAIDDEDLSDTLTSMANSFADDAYANIPQIEGAFNIRDDILSGKASYSEAFLRTLSQSGGLATGAGLAASRAAGAVGAEGIADDIGNTARQIEEEMAGVIVGKFDEQGEWNGGILGGDLDPNSPDFQRTIEARMGGFALLGGVGFGLVGGAVGAAGRRLKMVRGALTPDIARDALAAATNQRWGASGGLFGKVAETYRGPLRMATNQFDEAILKFARNPEDFFVKGIHGKRGRQLLQSLEAAKEAHPGDIDAQVGFIRGVYGDQIDTGLTRRMLEAPDADAAKRTFVEAVSGWYQGEDRIAKGNRRMADLEKEQFELTAGEPGNLSAARAEVMEDIYDPQPGMETGVLDDAGQPKRMFHGTGETFQEFDPAAQTDSALYGPGFYFTDNPSIASGYSGTRTRNFTSRVEADSVAKFYHGIVERRSDGTFDVTFQGGNPGGQGAPQVRTHFLGAKKPFDIRGNWKGSDTSALFRKAKAYIDRTQPPSGPLRKGDRIWDENGERGYTVRYTSQDGTVEATSLDDYDSMTLDAEGPLPEGFIRTGASEQAEIYAQNTGSYEGHGFSGDGVYDMLVDAFHDDKAAVTDFLQSEGYDSIRHVGGKRTGNEAHDVWIVFDPEQVQPGIRRYTPDQLLAAAKKRKTLTEKDIRKSVTNRLEMDALQHQLNNSVRNPFFRIPEAGFVRSIVRSPHTPLQRRLAMLGGLLRLGHGQAFDLAKWVDELTKYPELKVPRGDGVTAADLDANLTIVESYMRRAGVPAETVRKRIGELSQIDDPVEFYRFIEHKVFGGGGDIDAALPNNVQPEIRQAMLTLHDTAIEGRTKSTLKGVNDHVLGRELVDGETIPLPSRPTEVLKTITLPDVDLLIEANSFIRRIMRNEAGGQRISGKTYQAIKWAGHVSTAVLKPAVMIVRLPAMAMRIQLEQAARANLMGWKPIKMPDNISLFPGGIPIWGRKARIFSGLFGEDGWDMLSPADDAKGFSVAPDNADLGMFVDGTFDHVSRAESFYKSTAEFRAGRRTPKRGDYEAWRTELEQAHADWLDRGIAHRKLDVDETLAWLANSKNLDVRRFIDTELRPNLEASSIWDGDLESSMRIFVERRVDYLRMLTNDDADMLAVIDTGGLRLKDAGTPDFTSSGDHIQTRYNTVRGEITETTAEINTRIRDGHQTGTPQERAELSALQHARKDAIRKRRAIEERYGRDIDITEVKLGSKGDFRHELEARWQAQNTEFPPRIFESKRVIHSARDGGPISDAQRAMETFSAAVYRGFKPLTAVDKRGTRGSLFRQAYEREARFLKARGYTKAEVKAMAYQRAAAYTRDLMYDLNARTSVQRALKDIFWFAPAHQEVLYTWFVKIPSQGYWTGAVNMAGKLASAIAILEGTGVMQTDSNGERVIHLPFVRPLVEFLTAGTVKVPDIPFGKFSGLNIVSTGGGVPGLSSPAGFALGQAALQVGGPFKALSDVFQPYGPDVSLMPAPITYLWEAAFGTPPPIFSGSAQKRQWDRTWDSAIQYAYADLINDGKKPPRPEDFATDGVLSPEQEQAYQDAFKAWWGDLKQEADRYATGMSLVKMAGATVAPFSLYSTSEEREEWTEFYNGVISSGVGDEGLSQFQKDQISHFVAEHPSSLAFSIFHTGYGEKSRDLPFEESQDDAFFDKYYTGEKVVLSPEEYIKKLAAMESLRFYQANLSTQLDTISPDRDPWELLTNGSARIAAMTEYREEWDRFRFLNPAIAAQLDEQTHLWAEANEVPERSFEAQRLGDTIAHLRQLAPMLSGEEGIRPQFLKETMAEISALYSETGEFGAPRTETEKATAWWYENVMTPYIDQTSDLYEEATRLNGLGLDASGIYNQIRALNNAAPQTYKGRAVPTPEEVFYSNKSPEEQEATRLAWAGRPISWLSNFQSDTVGYSMDDGQREFFNKVALYDEDFYTMLNEKGWSPSSKEYQNAIANREDTLLTNANSVGPETLELMKLSLAQPYVRLNYTGYGASNPTWGQTSDYAANAIEAIKAADLSPKGYSGTALSYKLQMYAAIKAARATDPEYDKLFEELSLSYSLPNGDPMMGSVLYEAIFFGNFNSQYMPYELAVIGA